MADLVHPAPPPVLLPTTDGRAFPVRRVLAIGKNYADHVAEMGGDPKASTPVFFSKPVDAVICPTAAAPHVPYPPQTENLHYEGEIVLALTAGGLNLSEEAASGAIGGLALGCDLTRRDLQAAARDAGTPWDMAKGFDHSAVIGAVTMGAALAPDATFSLSVNDSIRQRAEIVDMIWPPAAIVSRLSTFVRLAPGDLIFTGTPEGVGPLRSGDKVAIDGAGLTPLTFEIV